MHVGYVNKIISNRKFKVLYEGNISSICMEHDIIEEKMC